MSENAPAWLSTELAYVALLFILFVVPRMLLRWRLPKAITAFALGAAAGVGFGFFAHDTTVHLLASFGIVALFLFAGLEVDGERLARHGHILARHLALQFALLAAGTATVSWYFGLGVRPAALVALALLSPSAGFILDSLGRLGLAPADRQWVADTVIASEVLALGVLFVSLQSASWERLGLATLALVALVAVLPSVFRFFAQRVAPYAPKSEFTFLLMMALLCAYATRQLGVYYLVGAFVVGAAARRFREDLPAIASEQMLHAVEVFAGFFVPFYFFSAGASLRPADLSWVALALAAVFLAVIVPVRIMAVAALRSLSMGNPFDQSVRLTVPTIPTLVFTLVIVDILRESFALPGWLLGALVVYTIANTLIPSFVFGAPVPAYDAPELPPVESGSPDPAAA